MGIHKTLYVFFAIGESALRVLTSIGGGDMFDAYLDTFEYGGRGIVGGGEYYVSHFLFSVQRVGLNVRVGVFPITNRT